MSNELDAETREAWRNNWEYVSIEKILEIFSYPRVKKQVDIFLKYLPRNEKILEGGCGLGPYVIYFKNMGFDIIGLDYNEEPLEKIKEYDSCINVLCGDVQALPFEDGLFGAYISLGVIEHFSEGPGRAIGEANRVLKRGGYFIVEVPHASIFYKAKYPLNCLKRSAIVRRIFGKRLKKYYWEQYFDVQDLRLQLEDSGFDVTEIYPVDHEHAVLTFSGLFRDRRTYDGINNMGVRFSAFCARHFPWMTAGQVIFICKKR